jgi:PilZ domain-containing protein
MTTYAMKERKTMPAQTNGLEANLHFACGSMPDYDIFERRSVPRIAIPFQATLRGVDHAGDRFRIDTILDNFSAAGLFLRLVQPIEPGATVFVVVRFAVAPAAWLAAPGVAARGLVVWAEPRPGAWGIALKFMRQRFLYAFAIDSA